MSPRVCVFVLFIIPVLAGRGGGHGGHHGGGHHGGYGGHHAYPASTGLSGAGTHQGSTHNTGSQNAGYPHSSTGLSGANRPHNTNYNTNYHKTEVHNHYHYSPPQQVSYGNSYHPVYRGNPPVYIYEYRDSGSRFSTLLTGLALYNLGRMSSSHHHSNSYNEYSGTPGEKCKFAISKTNGEYEETRIDCKLMSSFIWEVEKAPNHVEPSKTVTSQVEQSVTVNNGNTTSVTRNTTTVYALEAKGPSIKVTPDMTCYMIRVSRDSSMLKKQVDCGLLQTYAMSSFRSSSTRNQSVISSLIALCSILRLLQ